MSIRKGARRSGLRSLDTTSSWYNGRPQIDRTYFIGRASELSAMNEVLQPKSKRAEQQRLVLGGMGGIGKTQLATAYAKQYQQLYQSVFWHAGRSVSGLSSPA